MRETTALQYELDDRGLLDVKLDRPDHLNALNETLRTELNDLLGSVDTDEVRCVSIRGKGDAAFSAGADIDEFESASSIDEMGVTPVYETLHSFPRPTVAAIDGFCLGGGHELALACDVRIATTDAEFGFPEIDLGLYPGGGGTVRALRLLGETRAKELIFRGNRIDAEQAEDWGLVTRAVPPSEFDDVVDDVVTDLLEGPPVALKLAKSVLNQGADGSLQTALELESRGFGILAGTEDVAEGIAAFSEDRSPTFEGR